MAKQQKLIEMLARIELTKTLARIEARLSLMEDMLDDLIERARANGIQAATWTTPKSWAKAQVRPPQADSGRSDG